jgi:hypothetical protein
MKTITTEKQLLSILKKLHEQGEVPTPAPAPTPGPAPSPNPAGASPQAPTPSVPAEPITLDDIIEKLNVIRAGRSTKDDSVKSDLENYILQFSEEDKGSLLAFLDGLGRILTPPEQISPAPGGVPGAPVKSAPTPVTSPTPAPLPAAAPKSVSKSPVPINVGGI